MFGDVLVSCGETVLMSGQNIANLNAKRDQLSIDEQEWLLRVDVAAACRLAAFYGWDDQIATHITARLPGDGHRFLINPFGTYFEEITASSLAVLDEVGRSEGGEPVNVAGFMVHSSVHMGRDDARAVIHLHTNEAIAVGVSPTGLRNYSPFSMLVSPVAYHDWEGVVINPDERERMQADLGESNVMLLRNHGLLTVGETMAQAFQRAYFLQRACEIQLQAAVLGADLIEQPDSMTQLVNEQVSSSFGKSSQMNWDALLRKLDRMDPSYRD